MPAKPKLQQIIRICKKLGFDLISYSFLASGNHNECYLLKTKQADLVLKIENNPGYAKKEYLILRNLPKGLGPKVYLYDGSKKILPKAYQVLEFLTGKNPGKKVTDNFVRNMAKWFKKLHTIRSTNLPAKERKKIESLEYWAKFHYDAYLIAKKYLPLKLQQELEVVFMAVLKICQQNDKLFARRRSFHLVQNDPSVDNIFIYPQYIRVIDWEFAGYGLAERDIYNFFTSYILTDKQKNIFLQSYGYSKSNIANKRLQILSILLYLGGYDYLANRIKLIEQGKISSSQQSSTKKVLIVKFNKLIAEHKELIVKIKKLN